MKISELMPRLALHGRTMFDEKSGTLYFNWTCSGFTVAFTGKTLRARLTALGDQVPAFPGLPQPPATYPCLGVEADGSGELCLRTEWREADGWCTLWSSEESGSHVVRVVKLSENARGKLGVLELETDGEFGAAPEKCACTIEFIGDSITCAYGNEAVVNDLNFNTSEENGWMSYAAIAARELGYEYSLVCESGICACTPEHPMFPIHSMEDIYEYTDELCASRLGETPARWDFAREKSDIIVISLGTNDATPIRFYKNVADVDSMEAWFEKSYGRFVEKVRRLNGAEPYIVCTLGSMDYYLYDRLKAAVESYVSRSGDTRVCVFKLVGINDVTEGYGGADHPSLKTHIRVGHELAERIRQYVGI